MDLRNVAVNAGGRVILGVGRGYAPELFEAFAIERSAKRELFAECLAGIKNFDPRVVNGVPVYNWHYFPWSTDRTKSESVGHAAYDILAARSGSFAIAAAQVPSGVNVPTWSS